MARFYIDNPSDNKNHISYSVILHETIFFRVITFYSKDFNILLNFYPEEFSDRFIRDMFASTYIYKLSDDLDLENILTYYDLKNDDELFIALTSIYISNSSMNNHLYDLLKNKLEYWGYDKNYLTKIIPDKYSLDTLSCFNKKEEIKEGFLSIILTEIYDKSKSHTVTLDTKKLMRSLLMRYLYL